MELWQVWTSLLQSALTYLSDAVGVSDALAVVLLTLICRAILMPVSLTAAVRTEVNKGRLNQIKPQLEAIRERHKDQPEKLASETLRVYRENNVRLLDRLMLLNIGTQGVFGLGMFQVLSKALFSSKFLWIANLAKPDLWLTLLVSVLMALGMALMPGATSDQQMMTMMVVSVLVSAVTLYALPSAIALYWAASNAFTIAQTLALRVVMRRAGANGPAPRC